MIQDLNADADGNKGRKENVQLSLRCLARWNLRQLCLLVKCGHALSLHKLKGEHS